MGTRSHRVRYDPAAKAFFVLCADSQHISKLVRDGDGLRLVYKKQLGFLAGTYTRSMTLADGAMYFVAGPGYIFKVHYRDDSFRVLARYRVPSALGGMNDLYRTRRRLVVHYGERGRAGPGPLPGRPRSGPATKISTPGSAMGARRITSATSTGVIICRSSANATPSFRSCTATAGSTTSRVFCDFQGGDQADWQRSKEFPK